jgi:DUF1680 family protein
VGEGARADLNGLALDLPLIPGEYLEIRRPWQAGDLLHLDFPMPTRLLESHPYARENTGRLAVARGPILYCAESVDNPSIDLRQAAVLPEQPIQAGFRPDLLNGVVTLRMQAALAPLDPAWDGRLYRPYAPAPHSPASQSPAPLTLIPYFAWANREAGQMEVWVKV